MTIALADAVLTVMLALSPPERWTALPGHEEAPSARLERYGAIARDVAEVAKTPAAAALLVAVTYHESGWSFDVDRGECYRGPGWEKRCDAGRAVCIAQIQAAPAQHEAARTDRKACLRQGLTGIRRSIHACSKGPGDPLRFAGLSGSCTRGHAGSRRIHALHRRAADQIGAALRPKEPS
jgi:hypothetical protein